MPNVIYTVPERIEIVLQHAQGLSYHKIADHFAAAYPGRPIPSVTTIRNMVKKFRETGTININPKKVRHPTRQISEEMKLNICLKAEEDKDKPVSKIAKELGISKTSARKVLCEARYRTRKPRYLAPIHVDVKLEPMKCDGYEIKTEPVDPDPEVDPLSLEVEPANIETTFIKVEPFPTETRVTRSRRR